MGYHVKIISMKGFKLGIRINCLRMQALNQSEGKPDQNSYRLWGIVRKLLFENLVQIPVPEPLQTEFGIHHSVERCGT